MPRKTLKQRKERNEDIASLMRMSGARDPVSNMSKLLNVLTAKSLLPEPNKYYVFVYNAKTPGVTYDQHPLILCTGVYRWGFTGVNYHWGLQTRRYTWAELTTHVYELSEEEAHMLLDYPITKVRTA